VNLDRKQGEPLDEFCFQPETPLQREYEKLLQELKDPLLQNFKDGLKKQLKPGTEQYNFFLEQSEMSKLDGPHGIR